MVTRFGYKWVESHQDRYKLWHQLTIVQQLKCTRDMLTNRAVADSLDPRAQTTGKEFLLRESKNIRVCGIKQTMDVSKGTRFVLCHLDAEKFHNTPLDKRDAHGNRNKNGGLGWSKYAFYAVD